MKYLFFIVHPSKFYLFRDTINYLKEIDFDVDIVITSKDVLEELVISEGWNYTNIFPNGRKGNKLPALIYTIFNFIRTIIKLWNYSRRKNYDLFITDDLLVYVGKIKNTPSIVFLDDDIDVVRPFTLILSQASYILAPDVTKLGKYGSKKIKFPGYKELAYLHPNHFVPNREVIKNINPGDDKYFIVRLVNLAAYHDVGKRGISNDQLTSLINLLEKHGKIYITSERELPKHLEKYRLIVEPHNISHVLYFAEMFIGDSQTMCSEAAILGVPTFRCNDFKGKISVMNDKDEYELMYSYKPEEFEDMVKHINDLLAIRDLKSLFKKRKRNMLDDKIDVNKFIRWLLANFPESIKNINSSDFSYKKFK